MNPPKSLSENLPATDAEAPPRDEPPSAEALARSWRRQRVEDRLSLDAEPADLMACLFFADFYRTRPGVPVHLDDDGLFDHYLRIGVAVDLPPGPFFSPACCRARIWECGRINEDEWPALEDFVGPPEPAMTQWLRIGAYHNVVPTPIFDPESYLLVNEDVAQAGAVPFDHFIRFGQFEGRALGSCVKIFDNAIYLRSVLSRTPAADVYSLFPDPFDREALFTTFWKDADVLMQQVFYKAQFADLDEIVGAVGWQDFLASGAFNGRRPTLFYHDAFYRASWARYEAVAAEAGKNLPHLPKDGVSAFFHWATLGRSERISPTPLFREDLYRQAHADLGQYSGWLFEHFLNYGCKEDSRISCDVFNAAHYRTQRKESVDPVHLVDFVLAGASKGIQPAANVDLRFVREDDDFARETCIEKVARALIEKLHKLDSPAMVELIERAAFIEPLVKRPYGVRAVQYPPVKHAALEQYELGETIRKALKRQGYDSVVLIPHCRMAGSARVAGALVQAMAEIDPNEHMLLVQTDRSDFERPDWFGESMDILDFSALTVGRNAMQCVTSLMDLLRGVCPKRIVNVNSALGWNFMLQFGQQFSTWTRLFAYLFTWDLDAAGNKGGYPITGFQGAFDSLSGVITDNQFLADELAERYALPEALKRRIHVLHTPTDATDLDFAEVYARRREQHRNMRAFWCGRFDRQKRYDVLVEIARRRPGLEIYVWGKAVLNDTLNDLKKLPPNIRLQGTYENFDDLPLEACDFFLYTSAWDGLPTILIDAGARGIATVASRVGGTADLVRDDTSWPVDETADPVAYLRAIDAMLADPDAVTRRARRLREYTHALCARNTYVNSLRKVLHG